MPTMLPNPKPTTKRSRYPSWTTGDGSQVTLESMSDLHIARTIAYLERKAQERYPTFVTECFEAIGVMDADDVTQHMAVDALEDNAWEQCLHPMHEHLMAEAKRRALDLDALTGGNR